MKPQAYSFWCSRCRFAHAGECVVENPCAAVPALKLVLPPIGSRWVGQAAAAPQGPWTDNSPTEWEVEDLDAAGGMVAVASPSGTRGWLRGQFWRPEGDVDGGGYSRFRLA